MVWQPIISFYPTTNMILGYTDQPGFARQRLVCSTPVLCYFVSILVCKSDNVSMSEFLKSHKKTYVFSESDTEQTRSLIEGSLD